MKNVILLILALLISQGLAHAEVMSCGASVGPEDFDAYANDTKLAIRQLEQARDRFNARARRVKQGSAEWTKLTKKADGLEYQMMVKQQDFDASFKNFPQTKFKAYGVACDNRDWFEEAKADIWKYPVQRGKTFYIYVDNNSGSLKAMYSRPPDQVIRQ